MRLTAQAKTALHLGTSSRGWAPPRPSLFRQHASPSASLTSPHGKQVLFPDSISRGETSETPTTNRQHCSGQALAALTLVLRALPVFVMSCPGLRAVDPGKEGGLCQVQRRRTDAKRLGDASWTFLPHVPAERTRVTQEQLEEDSPQVHGTHIKLYHKRGTGEGGKGGK